MAAVVRLRAGVRTSRAGDEVPDWTDPARLDLTHLVESVQPETSVGMGAESREGTRVIVTRGWRVFGAEGADLDVTSADRIELAGITCEVVGEPARWADPDFPDRIHHVELLLQRVQG